jgi:hypothetical protein
MMDSRIERFSESHVSICQYVNMISKALLNQDADRHLIEARV